MSESESLRFDAVHLNTIGDSAIICSMDGIIQGTILSGSAVRWNTLKVNGYECLDHPEVTGTSYMEVHHLIGTSGCSKDEHMWQWSVMGVITTRQGKLLVNPGDWVVELTKGHFLVLDDTTYRNLYL